MYCKLWHIAVWLNFFLDGSMLHTILENTWAHWIEKPLRIVNSMPFAYIRQFSRAPLSYRDSIQTVNWARVRYFPLCAQLGFDSFLSWRMNLGGGAAVEWDYRPQSSKP